MIPECLAHLPTHGSLPVPYFTGQTKDGKWDFRTHNPQRHDLAMRYRLCAICGKYLGEGPYVFVFGPLSLGPLETFMPPQHEECARVALAICPFLFNENHVRSDRDGGVELCPAEAVPPKPDRIALVWCESYRYWKGPSGILYATALGPLRAEWYAYVNGKLTIYEEAAQ
jgi:hypothetical protein